VKGGLLSAWLVAVAIITYRGVKQTPRTTPLPMPLPSTYASSFLIYGGLGLLPPQASPFTTAMGWGLVVAMGLGLWNPNSKNGPPQVNNPTQTAEQLAATTKG
jgi:uncharacterized membrane protein